MARTAASGKLKARFDIATPGDNAEIRRLLRENPMGGAVNVAFEREPDYFQGTDLAGGKDQTIVAREDGRLVCVGRCIRRECWLNGIPHDVGYLGELRLDATARGRFSIVRDGFRFFFERESGDPAAFYFTSIAADNQRARRLLESRARGLPEYRFLGGLETLLVAVPRRPSAPRIRIENMRDTLLPEVVELLRQQGREFGLGAVWTECRLRALLAQHLSLECCYVAYDGPHLVAFGALWDQRSFRQTVVRGYAPLLGTIRPLMNWASRVFGTVRLPEVGEILPQVFLSPCTLGSVLPDFIGALLPHVAALGAHYLTLALPESDASSKELRRRFVTRTWRSRLYGVALPGKASPSVVGPFLPDIGLL